MFALISAGKKRSDARALPKQPVWVFRIHEIRHAALTAFGRSLPIQRQVT
jgi:hypothetical protein